MKKIQLTLSILFTLILCSFTDKGPWTPPKDAGNIENPFAKNQLATRAGAIIFAQQCVICHGEKGKGDGIAAVGLDTKPANFTSEKVQSNTDGSLFWKITTGRTPMPSFKTILSDQQRWQVVNYIREFRSKTLTAKK